MKTNSRILDEVIQLINLIRIDFPEIYRNLEEMPFMTISGDNEIETELKVYHDSLIQIIRSYKEAHLVK